MRSLSPPGFPPEVQEVFDALRNEVTFLHGNWDAFHQLFGTPESVAALNETAPGAFRLIRFVFRHEFIMAISRITDPKATGYGKKAKENLTLKQLLHVIGEHCTDQAFINDLTNQEKVIDAHCQPIRDNRNRSIGHLDLETALNYHPNPLPDINTQHVVESLRLLAEFMNTILGYYKCAHADFVPVVTGPARNIVHGLRQFHRLRKAEYERQSAELQAEAEAAKHRAK
jgi:AbiU2